MRVCILSMQNVDNFGSLLQAYALKETIEGLGDHTVEFLGIRKSEEDWELPEGVSLDYSDECERGGVIGKLYKLDRYMLNRPALKKREQRQKLLFHEFRTKILGIGEKGGSYGCCVIGSDEVFNCLNAGEWGFTSQLFGNVPEAERVITYAACCGATKYEQIPAEAADKIRQAFRNISAFSVRDRNTYEFASRMTEKRIGYHLDPAMIYDFQNEMTAAVVPELPEHYCVIYSYRNRIKDREEINRIKQFCTTHQLVPVAVGAPQFWIRNYVVCTPFACLKIFQNADFIITDTFHGTVFSLKFADKFAIMMRGSNQNKLSDLIKRFDAGQHLADGSRSLEQIYQSRKNDAIYEKIKCETERSVKYLERNLV